MWHFAQAVQKVTIWFLKLQSLKQASGFRELSYLTLHKNDAKVWIISYLSFLGFYTGWLFPAAVVGVLVFLYGVATMNSNTIAVETCQEGGEYKMCPLCEDCDYWDLKDICLYKRLAYLFDHPGTVFYAIFMSFWGKNATMIVLHIKNIALCAYLVLLL